MWYKIWLFKRLKLSKEVLQVLKLYFQTSVCPSQAHTNYLKKVIHSRVKCLYTYQTRFTLNKLNKCQYERFISHIHVFFSFVIYVFTQNTIIFILYRTFYFIYNLIQNIIFNIKIHKLKFLVYSQGYYFKWVDV